MAVDNMTELRKRIPGGKYALARAIAEEVHIVPHDPRWAAQFEAERDRLQNLLDADPLLRTRRNCCLRRNRQNIFELLLRQRR